ncbi:MAG TPA: hypothetical protein VK209_03290 [Candidatus Sulfotelmatobacter sp.]|nr:hypothetical protein [Candidatus Sulfotelmatobacter sp.]
MTKRSISETLPAFTIEEDNSSKKIETRALKKINATLNEIYNIDGVLCTLLKNSACAYVNIRDGQKIFDLAMLIQNLAKLSEKFLEYFNAGSTKRIIFEGKTLKVLVWNSGETQVSIFMTHEVDYSKILEELSEQVDN